VQFENLTRIEATLQKLRPPRWPEDLLGQVDKDKAEKGRLLFNEICARCHGPHIASQALKSFSSPGRLPSDPMWDIRTVDKAYIGTDPTEVDNFSNDRIDLTRSGITFDDVMPILKTEMNTQKARYDATISALKKEIAAGSRPGVDQAMLDDYKEQLDEMQKIPVTEESIAKTLGELDMRALNAGYALNMVGMLIRHKFYRDNHITYESDHLISGSTHGCFAGFDALDIPQVEDGYKPRPLEGVWATPPFLHNGSVPTLYDLLSPVEDRPTEGVYVGRREFDPVKVGYVTEPAKGPSKGFWMNTKKPGNLNTGHQFLGDDPPNGSNTPRPPGVIGRGLTPEERYEIIEYLKIHQDSPDTPDKPARTPPDCVAMMQLK